MYHMHVYYTARDKETLCRFFEAVKREKIMEKTREEDGNLKYEYYFSAERENEILIVEEWKSKESQQHHDGLNHILKLMEIKAEYGILTQAEEIDG